MYGLLNCCGKVCDHSEPFNNCTSLYDCIDCSESDVAISRSIGALLSSTMERLTLARHLVCSDVSVVGG